MDGLARREALGLLAAGSMAAGALGSSPAFAAAPSLSTPEGKLRAYLLMRGALDDRVVTGWALARYFGVVDGEITPLFGVSAATFSQYRRQPDGSVHMASAEYAFFTDSDGTKVIETAYNPYTSETVTIPTGGFPPAKVKISPDLHYSLLRDIPGMQFEHVIHGPQVRAGDVRFTDITRVASTIPGAPKAFRYSEVLNMQAKEADILHPAAKQVGAEVSFTIVCDWRPWMKMGTRPGHMLCVGNGRIGGSADALPKPWLDGMKARHPDVLADPAKVLAPVWR